MLLSLPTTKLSSFVKGDTGHFMRAADCNHSLTCAPPQIHTFTGPHTVSHFLPTIHTSESECSMLPLGVYYVANPLLGRFRTTSTLSSSSSWSGQTGLDFSHFHALALVQRDLIHCPLASDMAVEHPMRHHLHHLDLTHWPRRSGVKASRAAPCWPHLSSLPSSSAVT